MGGSNSAASAPLQLPQQEVVALPGARLSQPRAPGRASDAAARTASLTTAEHLHTGQVKIPLVWDRASLSLRRAEAGKHVWHLSADFTADVTCEFTAHFHCKAGMSPDGLQYTPASQGGPPSFTQTFSPGKHSAVLDRDRSIDLQRWPLEVFWKYRQRNADVFPIVFSLSSGDVQSVIHLTLEVPSRSSSEKEPRCTLLQQKVVVGGKEYVLQEVYGLADLGRDDAHDETAVGEPCVICLSEPRTTAIKPCRHLCVCEECGGQLQAGAALRNDRCPICRGPIEGMQVFDVGRQS